MSESFPITDYNTLRGLDLYTHQDRRLALSELRRVIGLDTETDSQGNLRLIADSDGVSLDKITPESVFSYLFSKKYQGSWNFFYNIKFDAEIILKLLGKENLDNYKKSGFLKFEFDKFKIEYIPEKKLAIRKGHHSAVFFDIMQYFKESLANAYLHNIGKLPDDYIKMKSKRSAFSEYFWKRSKKKIRYYCIQDCINTRKLAEHWIKLFHDSFLFYPARWISPAYLSEKVLFWNNIHIPRFQESPLEVHELATNSYFGGRFEILKRGYIGQAYLYDINSAYPFALTKVPNFTKGRWIRQKTIHPKALLGFFKISANIPDVKVLPPFPFRKNIMVCYPSGKFGDFVTLEELRAVKDTSWYEILDSWQYLDENPEYPYKEFIESLYEKRLALKIAKNPQQLAIKTILNSIYGKTGEVVQNRIGNIFNPIIFSFITGFARAKLYSFVIKNNIERDVVAFATDSVCTTKKVSVGDDKLGDFSLANQSDDVYYLQNGFYRFDGKWKQRGLGSLGSREIEHIDTIERDGKLLMKYKVTRPQRLKSAILQNLHGNIGKFSVHEREFNLNADKKRQWLGKLESINDGKMNVSIPLSLNHLLKSNL
ncbi:MAG: DNA polymerase [Thaumarchaeota archaeon]|nr:DNA polymerase [Nitrososphaerota archaeon]